MQPTKMLSLITASLVALSAFQADNACAHPGLPAHEDNSHTLAARRLFATNAKLSYEACQGHPHARQLEETTVRRRLAKLTELRADVRRRRRLATSDDVLATSHKSTIAGTTATAVDAKTLFGATPTCVLQPEVTHGPYYVKGELIRNDIRESQPGIDLFADIQVIDTKTCTPVGGLYVDFWHANATGVYSGVVTAGNGDASDESNLDATFARGLYPTDADGVVQFITKFPGHYAGRAPHIHVLGNYGGEVLPNKTYVGASVSNIGQIFFDQDLITSVEATTVYAANNAAITKNCGDLLFLQSAASGFDPVVNYAFLGDRVEDGIFSWISIGVDVAATKAVRAAATLTASGGVASAVSAKGMDRNGSVPKGPGPQAEWTANATSPSAGDEDAERHRSPVFSVLFFIASASALAAILYYFPTKKNPRRMYAPMMSA